VTTPEQLLADAKWRRRHSLYTLWALFIGFGFVSLFYTGVRSKKNKWTTVGVIYGVLTIASISIGSAVSPKDPEAPTPLAENIAMTIFFITWVVSAIHVFRERKEWLRWKASAVRQPQWYETPVGTTAPLAPDLTALAMDDPTADYLAPPPPKPAASSGRRLPPPPVAPPPHAATTHQPPPPPPRPPSSKPPAPAAPPAAAVDLNTADVDEIAALPGVGIATATRIVEERKRRSGFESVDEAALAAQVRPHVRSRLQQMAVVSDRPQPQRRSNSGRIVDI